MFKTFSAAALSLTIGLTSFGATATPAQANEDIGKFIVGAIALGIIANAVNQTHAGNNTATVTTTTQRHQPRTNHQPRANRQQHRGVRIPARCERQMRVNNRNRNVYRAGCLRRNNVNLRRISECARRGSINGRNMTYYVKGCLRRNGHRV